MQEQQHLSPATCEGLSRRSFLLRSGALCVTVAFGAASPADAMAQPASFRPNGWIHVGTDDIVTVYCASAEMGQGVKTSMPLLVAEDMDLDWPRVRVEQAPHDPKVFGNPLFGGGMSTGGSRTTRGLYEIMRLAGLQAREVLRACAAQHWQVPLDQVATVPHAVVHKPSGRRLRYGQVAAFAQVPANMPAVTPAQLKPRSQFRLLGKDTPRIDVPDKTRGKAQYGIDLVLPGMLHAAVLRAPVQGEKPEKIGDARALKVQGVRKIVPLPYGVGVIADSWWAARTARDALEVEWSATARARSYSSEPVLAEYRQRARAFDDKGVEFVRAGDPDAALKTAAHVIDAEFSSQHLAHVCMEPMNCSARVDGDAVEIWAPTQSQSSAVAAAVRQGFKPENVTCHMTLMGGGFGRRVEMDFVTDAVLLAKAMPGKPVKVLWTREDDIQNDKYRPLIAQHVSAGMDAQGKLLALRHRIVGESIYARAAPAVFEKAGGRDMPVCEGAEHLAYGIPDRAMYYLREQRGFDVGFWRGIGVGYTKYAIETLMDDLAATVKQDPLAFRLQNLAEAPRAQAVLRAVARMAGWENPRPAGRALGIGYSDAWGSHVAEVAEISIDARTGRIRVHEVWCAVDPGFAIQPGNVAAQMESAIMNGISAALGEKVVVEKGQPLPTNFHDYRVLRMDEAPRVQVEVLSTDNKPGGVGEVGLPPIAAAISNAVYRLTQKRLRDLPLDEERLRA